MSAAHSALESAWSMHKARQRMEAWPCRDEPGHRGSGMAARGHDANGCSDVAMMWTHAHAYKGYFK